MPEPTYTEAALSPSAVRFIEAVRDGHPFVALPIEWDEERQSIWAADGDGVMCDDDGRAYVDDQYGPIVVAAVNAMYEAHREAIDA